MGAKVHIIPVDATSFATAQIEGNRMGIVEKFAHTRVYTDSTFTFYVDSDYRALEFFELWHEFQERKVNAHKLIRKAESMVSDSTPQANELLEKAKFYDDIYDFLDAERFAEAAIEWAEYEN